MSARRTTGILILLIFVTSGTTCTDNPPDDPPIDVPIRVAEQFAPFGQLTNLRITRVHGCTEAESGPGFGIGIDSFTTGSGRILVSALLPGSDLPRIADVLSPEDTVASAPIPAIDLFALVEKGVKGTARVICGLEASFMVSPPAGYNNRTVKGDIDCRVNVNVNVSGANAYILNIILRYSDDSGSGPVEQSVDYCYSVHECPIHLEACNEPPSSGPVYILMKDRTFDVERTNFVQVIVDAFINSNDRCSNCAPCDPAMEDGGRISVSVGVEEMAVCLTTGCGG